LPDFGNVARGRIANVTVSRCAGIAHGWGEATLAETAGDGTPRNQWAPDARALGVVGDRWMLVIVRDLAGGPLRRKTLGCLLPGLSAGALQERLHHMEKAGLLVRHRESALPPRVDFELTEQGYALADALAELARWELRTRWSAPRADEWVDVGACFRLAPLLARAAGREAEHDDELALELLEPDGSVQEQYAFVRHGGRARLDRRRAPVADARLSGTQEAWVRALSPGGTIAALAVSGREPVAAAFLELFASAAAAARGGDR
jgi:DNA-binding HxlR family transcriptional regulator